MSLNEKELWEARVRNLVKDIKLALSKREPNLLRNPVCGLVMVIKITEEPWEKQRKDLIRDLLKREIRKDSRVVARLTSYDSNYRIVIQINRTEQHTKLVHDKNTWYTI
jgi:hypothetical protein